MNQVPWIPQWLGEWADDSRENSRTAYPFILLGGVAAVFFKLSHERRFRAWFGAWVALVLVVVIAELGQLRIPTRGFSFADMSWGALGAGVGLFVIWIIVSAIHRLRQKERSILSRKDEGEPS